MLTLLAVAILAGGTPSKLPGPPSPDPKGTVLRTALLPGVGQVQLELTPFSVLDERFRVEGGSAPEAGDSSSGLQALTRTAESVVCRRGSVVGVPGSRAYLAESPRGRLGFIELGGRRFALAPAQGSWAGPVSGPGRWVESPGAGAPLVDEPCRLLVVDEGGLASGIPVPSPESVRGMRVRVAADCDVEFTSIFADAEDCTAYVVSLYGGISAIYEDQMGVRVQLSYLRLWLEGPDPFDAPDPLSSFRTLWNQTQQDVVRDVAQLLTGRRNLPYGGVAWLSAACGDFGYSVCGYLIGSFVDAGRTDPGNWDLIVTAHELGHNIGTLHTHDYDIDDCASGQVLRGGIMSYCHTVSGATANVDLTFHRIIRQAMAEFMAEAPCLGRDCDGDGVEDGEAIATGTVADLNRDGVPDACQDCDDDGTLDPDEIAAGAADLDADGVPDACQPDCNGNGVVDLADIQQGTSEDAWANDVPDECETDCNGNGQSDYTEILADMSLDRDRDGRLDACQDCDGDGTLDAEVLGASRHWWVASSAGGSLRELHPRSGVTLRASAAASGPVRDLALAADGTILGTVADAVVRWDAESAQILGTFGSGGLGGAVLNDAQGLLVAVDGSILVANYGGANILRYSSGGAPQGVFASLASGRPVRLARRSDGVIAVSASDGRVYGFAWPTGAPAGTLADLNALGAAPDPTALLYLPDGDLLVASRGFDSIERFDGATGSYLGRFDVGPSPGSSIALRNPMALRLIAGGAVVLATGNTSGAPIVGFDAESGYHLRTFRVYPADAPSPTGLLVMPESALDCNANFVPDSCDVSSGWSEDRNGDGTPDECQGGPWAPEDLDFDGQVNGADLGTLLGFWGACGAPCPADFDGSGVVDGDDLGSLLGAWTG